MTSSSWTIKTCTRHRIVTAVISSLCLLAVCNLFLSQAGTFFNTSRLPKDTTDRSKRETDVSILRGSEASPIPKDAVPSSAGLGPMSSSRDKGRRGLLGFLAETDIPSPRPVETYDAVQLEPVSLGVTSRLTCPEIQTITDLRYISRGWTKVVHAGTYRGQGVAVKTVDIRGHDVATCLADAGNLKHCSAVVARKIVREIVLLEAVRHENVIKVLGFCIPQNSSVVMVTELGEPIDQIRLLQMSWDDRLRVAFDVTQLIHNLARTPHGSLALNDFRRTQFVLVNGSLKLTDVDDATFGEPACSHDDQCTVVSEYSSATRRLSCVAGHCQHHNEFSNIMKAGHYFITSHLSHGVPGLLKPWIDDVIRGYLNLSMDTERLLQVLCHVIGLYRSGAYLGRKERKQELTYTVYRNCDLPGKFDYRCGLAVPGTGCTLSVFNLQEAMDVCDLDSQCKGFIWTHRKTWTGRTMIHLKNGTSNFSMDESTDFYAKPS